MHHCSLLTASQLIILSGYPCSGLSYRAHQLASAFSKTQDELLASSPPLLKSPYKIHIVPMHDSSHPRTVYDRARAEKEARGVAYTRARRALGKDSIVILDGMNYIKGYRYQLWCEAKELGTTSCVVCSSRFWETLADGMDRFMLERLLTNALRITRPGYGGETRTMPTTRRRTMATPPTRPLSSRT